MTSARATLLRTLIQQGPTPIARLHWLALRPAIASGHAEILWTAAGRCAAITPAGKAALELYAQRVVRGVAVGVREEKPLFERALRERGSWQE